jgi:hypothetical protein
MVSMSRGFLKGAMPMLALLLPCVAAGQTYTVEVRPILNDLDVKIETVAMTGALTLRLTNNTAGRVRCDLRYDAAPQTPRRTTTFVDPGRTAQSTFRARRKWFSVVVDVDCRPAER